MARQAAKTVFFVLCCVELILSQSPEPISRLDHSVNVFDKSGVPNEIRGQVMKSDLAVYCNNDSMKVILPPGSLSQVQILGIAEGQFKSVLNANSACGYSLKQGHGHNILVVDYAGCFVTLEDGLYTLRILYPNELGKLDFATVSCDLHQTLTASLKQLGLQTDEMPKCSKLPPTQISPLPSPLPTLNTLLLTSKPGGCSISSDKRVLCSTSSITQNQCLTRGCCFDVITSVCYYPMDECTADKNFVFAVHNDFTNIDVNPMSFMVVGKTGCKPVISNKEFAIFKFSVTECGTRSFVIGETLIYLTEVQTIIKVRNLKFGMISRDNPIRLMIECRYSKVSATPVFARPFLASAGYMVMSPILPSYLLSEGILGVQLLISEDESFTKFYPQFHQPLNVLLGKPVYLELRLKSPKPAATLLVHYCVAYPRSAKSALVLLFEGCPNPLDPGNTSILYVKHLPQSRHQRRFEIKAFQFMDLSTNKYLNEEIYFMCSTEVCMPSELPCAETCFDGNSS